MDSTQHPHHDGSPLHVSSSAPRVGDEIVLSLRVPVGYRGLERVHLRSTLDHEPYFVEAAPIGESGGWFWWEAAIQVRNARTGYRWMLTSEDGGIAWLGQGGLSDIETRDSEDFALIIGDHAPPWLSGAVMYQAFPDRFARSAIADDRALPDWAMVAAWDDPIDPVSPARTQQFYGGDLDGMTEHLDHLVSLGVGILYLTPIFPAASNHRYDAATFAEVDPLLGGDDALIRLVSAAHAHGIKVMGDLTSNHSGSDHEWFRAAHRHPGANEEHFYYFSDQTNSSYVSWLGYDTLPKFDWASRELGERFIDGPDSVVGRWLRPPYSLDGWRIDVANMTGRLDLDDRNADVRRRIRRTMTDINPDTYLVAEYTADATGDLQGDGWHGAMTYVPFTRPLWNWLGETSTESYVDAQGETVRDPWYFGQPVHRIPRFTARQFAASVDRFTSGIPWSIRLGMMNTLDSHDTARFATHSAPAIIPLAVGLSMTLPGLPVVWAGDEWGALGVDGETSRTPMPWNELHEADKADRISLYRTLIALRREHDALSTGGMRWIHVDDDVVVFAREGVAETVLVLASKADVVIELAADAVLGVGTAALVHGDAVLTAHPDGTATIEARGPVFAAWVLPALSSPGTRGIRDRGIGGIR